VVLEAKHHEVRNSAIKECYCQAANGVANSLALLNSLTTGIIAWHSVEEIQPVVAFTFIGYRTRVWLASITSREKAHEGIRVKYVRPQISFGFC
jgi:hypothetical protein